MTTEQMQYLVCPCFSGDQPFFVSTMDAAAQYVITEEYYAIDIVSRRFVEADKDADDDSIYGELSNDPVEERGE